MSIWCLFSVENNYDQPENNLVAWWNQKPTIEKLAEGMDMEIGEDDEITVLIVNVWSKGRGTAPGGTRYRLEPVAEGILK